MGKQCAYGDSVACMQLKWLLRCCAVCGLRFCDLNAAKQASLLRSSCDSAASFAEFRWDLVASVKSWLANRDTVKEVTLEGFRVNAGKCGVLFRVRLYLCVN
jgi:hypothetical protein